MTKTLPPITLENALKAYRKADAVGRALLEDLHGKETFRAALNIMERVASFQDICDISGVMSCTFELPRNASRKQIRKNAGDMLELIIEVLNEGWEPDYSNSNEQKWYPYFEYNKRTGRFSYSGYVYDNVYSFVGSRLVFKNRALAEFAGKLFIDIYNDYMLY